jgi:hypothetical protein
MMNKVSQAFRALSESRPYTYEYVAKTNNAPFRLYKEGKPVRDFGMTRLRVDDYVDALNEAWLAGYAKGCADFVEDDVTRIDQQERDGE